MIDNAVKTSRLLDALKDAVPFKVELVPSQIRPSITVSDLSYAGDEGGIVCHIVPSVGREALVVSLTQVRVPRSMALAVAVADYHNHRVKKLKKQGRS